VEYEETKVRLSCIRNTICKDFINKIETDPTREKVKPVLQKGVSEVEMCRGITRRPYTTTTSSFTKL
jgi:hypothetical protein